MNANEPVSELERLIRILEVFIVNFGLSDGPKIDDAVVRLDLIRLLEFLCELRKE